MAQKNYILYQKTNPFPGWIRGVDQVDVDQIPDGSTKKERYVELLIKYPDSDIAVMDFGDLPDPEAVKYDVGTGNLIPLDPGDITPDVANETKVTEARAQIALDKFDDMTYADIATLINSISNADSGTKTILIRLAIMLKAGRDEKN